MNRLIRNYFSFSKRTIIDTKQKTNIKKKQKLTDDSEHYKTALTKTLEAIPDNEVVQNILSNEYKTIHHQQQKGLLNQGEAQAIKSTLSELSFSHKTPRHIWKKLKNNNEE